MRRRNWLILLLVLSASACSPSSAPIARASPTVAAVASPNPSTSPTPRPTATPTPDPTPTVTPEAAVWPIGQPVAATLEFFEAAGWSFDEPVPVNNGDPIRGGVFGEPGLEAPFMGLADRDGVIAGLQMSAPLSREPGLISAIAALVSDSPELAHLAAQATAGNPMDETIQIGGTPIRVNVYQLSEGRVRAVLTVGVVGTPG